MNLKPFLYCLGCYNNNTTHWGGNNKHLLLIVLETGKSKMEVLVDPCLKKATSWFAGGHLLRCPHRSCLLSFHQGFIMGVPPL